jgi:hypothetical protein
VNKSKTYMNTRNPWLVMFCLALFCILALPKTMMADEWDRATKLTFNEPVEVPGQVLPRVLSKRCVVRVHPKKVMDHAALRSDLRSQKS